MVEEWRIMVKHSNMDEQWSIGMMQLGTVGQWEM